MTQMSQKLSHGTLSYLGQVQNCFQIERNLKIAVFYKRQNAKNIFVNHKETRTGKINAEHKLKDRHEQFRLNVSRCANP